MKTEKFDSSRGVVDAYTMVIGDDGRMSCDCKGWTIKKGDKVRECTHTKEVILRDRLRVERRGDYQYVVATRAEVVREVAAGRFTGSGAVVESRPATFAPKPKSVEPVSSGPNVFVNPMLAEANGTVTNWSEWAVEEKFDGHRVVIAVNDGAVQAWSRPGAGKKEGKVRELPAHITEAFAAMPNGTYDGELMGKEGGTFADVRRVGNQKAVYFSVFDLLMFKGKSMTGLSYDDRRNALESIWMVNIVHTCLKLAESVNVASEADVVAFVAKVWKRKGEGAILKRRAARYQAGKRSPDFLKFKKLGHAVVTVTGFVAGKLGPHATVSVVDAEGRETTVKTLNNEELRNFASGRRGIGMRLQIEFTCINEENNYVNPRWDRWEDQ